MALTPGTRLGAYEILALLGCGGMGEIYRARDTRLNRTVAIKVLRENVATDPQRRERFEREARAISILTHPHICTLHDVGHQDGIDYLVMELLEGQTLAERLARGALPLDQALEYAVQIADALDTAHRHGIVHRDLKPANVMLTNAGAKLVDFGIAKKVAPGWPALTMTTDGTLLGTLQYMAPEQLEGRDADTRSDLFAFGAVLYEMLTGRRAFPGESQSATIAAVLDSEPPPIDTIQPQAPPVLTHVVKTLLAKNPDQRWQGAADLTRALRWATESGVPAKVSSVDLRARRIRRLTPTLLALACVAVPSWIVFSMSQRRQGPTEVRFTIEPPPMANPFQVSVSPDGRQVAFVASSSDGIPRLFVRPTDSTTPRPLPGTEYALQPFWSPDSRSIGFGAIPQVAATGAKLKRIEVSGGPPQSLCDLGIPFFGGTWNSSGVIVFSSNGRLYRSSAAGGAPTPIRSPAPASYAWPYFLPDGLHYLITAATGRNRVVYVAALNADEPKRLMLAESMVAYAPPGELLFVREGTLVAQPFDKDRLEIRGEPVLLADSVLFNTVNGRAAFAVSDTGTLAYRTGSGSTESWRWQWMDRSGNVVPVETALASQSLRLSPDGKRVAFSERVGDAAADIWIYDVERNVRTRLTNNEAEDHWPAWSPDGSRVVFDSPRTGSHHVLYEKQADGAIGERVVLQPEPGMSYGVLDWSLDGRFILFGKTPAAHRAPASPPGDVWVLPVSGDEKPFPYRAQSFGGQAALSPDGRWLAYTSDETGRAQVVVQPFPDPSGGRWQVSRAGGAYPRWRRDGRELYYVENNALVALSITTVSSFTFGKSTELFHGLLLPPTYIQGPAYPYDVTADGQRFLVSSLAARPSGSPITVVLNWTERLNR